MEKYVDSDYIQHEYDASKTSDTETCGKYHLSNDLQEAKRKAYCKTSRVRKKIASNKEVSRGESNTGNIAGRHFNKTKDVLKTNVEEEETKTIQRNVVPDRLGKQLSSSNVGRSETKSLDVGDLKRKMESSFGTSEGVPITSETPPDERTHTKLPLLGTECLSNKEAVSLRNSFECVSEAQNIFENFFGDCLDSTRKGNDASSHGTCESEEGFRECERTPARKKPETEAPSAPTKDHGQYYASQKTVTRHVCGYCQKIFKSNGKLNSHVYSHTGERPFDCNHCGKAFSSKFKLVRHLLIHSEIRRFVCQICDRTFLRNDHLKNHYKVHDPQKKMYKCPRENCDKEYSSVMSHKKHMAYHSVEDGDLKCFMCNVKFETKEEILFHLKSHSGSRLFKTQSDKKFKCDFCDRLFLTRKDVTRHLVVHTGERDFLCQFCPQRFGRKDHLVRHIKKSHGNEEISVKCEGGDGRKQEEGKSKALLKRCLVKEEGTTPEVTEDALSSPQRRLRFPTKENTQAEGRNNKTHIVITVQGKSVKGALENRKRKYSESGNKKKSFQRSESLVPKKKVPLAKGKNSTTQILLQNIPNILIIPNNSIILLRNQTETCKDEKGVEKGEERKTENPAPCLPEEPERVTKPPPFVCGTDGNGNFPSSFPYEASSMFQPASHFLEGFSDSDSFCNFQPDFSSFGSHFEDSEHISFEMLGNADLMTRTETGLGGTETDGPSVRSDGPSNGGTLLTETSRQIKLLEEGMTGKLDEEKGCGDIGKDLFEDGNESLILNEVSILNEFKDESSSILPADNDIGILNNILNQTSDNCGFEILRNLLTAENPVLSPLPGFNQIFHNSNANSS